MKKILLSFFILIASIGMTQITVTDTDFAASGDTAMVSFSDEAALDLVTTGSNSTWDFSAINISAQSIDTFNAVSSSELLFQLIYNNSITYPEWESDWFKPWTGGALGQLASFGIGIEAPVQFTAVRTNEVVNTGLGMYIQGNGFPFPSDTVDVQYVLPMNYGDSWAGSSYTNMDMNPAFDMIYRRYQWRNSIVDGWGMVTTPFGTFDAIRVKSLVTSLDSLYIGQFGTWLQLPVPDQVEYHWFSNGEKLPVFSVTTSDINGNETITEIKFKDKFRTFASTEEITFDGSIYPNPASNELTINMLNESSLIEVFDVSGRLVLRMVPTSLNMKLDVSNWDKGIYLLKVNQTDGISSAKFLVE
jgi:Secretion system C-terminal sorting domain